MVKQFTTYMAEREYSPENAAVLLNAIDLAKRSRKFLLPHNGRLFDDPEFRSLDENEPLHLPFEVIALEYQRSDGDEPIDEQEEPCSKAIVFAEELPEVIRITPIAWVDRLRIWAPWPQLMMPRIKYLAREHPRKNGYVAIRAYKPHALFENDYHDELGALLCFVNVLQCRNVAMERCERRVKTSNTKKDSLPFDTYHVLKIKAPNESTSANSVGGGTHRSPREHLRRGHIRRLSEDHKIWVNATVVAAGSRGTIAKDYKLETV